MDRKTARVNRPRGIESPLAPKVQKVISRLHVAAYRRTGGRIGKNFRIGAALRKPVPVCLLTHNGRRSGREFTTPLLFLQDGERIVLVASQGGLRKNPQWFLNVCANPEVVIQVGRSARSMRALPATPEERALLWPRLVGLYADFETYQSWTHREIPVVICEPTADS